MQSEGMGNCKGASNRDGCGLAVKREVGKQKDVGSVRFGSPFSSKTVVYGHCLVTLPTQLINIKMACTTAHLDAESFCGDSIASRC